MKEFKELEYKCNDNGIMCRDRENVISLLKEGFEIIAIIPVGNWTKVILKKEETFDPDRRVNPNKRIDHTVGEVFTTPRN